MIDNCANSRNMCTPGVARRLPRCFAQLDATKGSISIFLAKSSKNFLRVSVSFQ